MATVTKTRNSIRFRGRSFLALVLAPELPLQDWFVEFDDLLRRSPSFFIGRAVVLDVTSLNLDKAALADLIAKLFDRKVRVMGVEGAKASSLGLGMPPAMSGGRVVDVPDPVDEEASTSEEDEKPKSAPPPQLVPATSPSLVVDHAVRSGQSIVFPEGDVTVIGSVASGAEIVAGGSVHVYGPLRGRVLAGTTGNPSARIFCHKLEAELLSIDGLYQTADEMQPGLLGRPVQVWLKDDTLMFAALD
ncbi:septum site-determining protein MinC [Chthonobacter rhizosphaerae]|uniref:septum site-determining protein MinC n=1 Tax=Chthonobacter rhizosphaerae TaxID=2735553 RepID=UPI0015EFB4C7|nr:septum site-determining protein MinC [Chthonobacter rhizosphaerae]